MPRKKTSRKLRWLEISKRPPDSGILCSARRPPAQQDHGERARHILDSPIPEQARERTISRGGRVPECSAAGAGTVAADGWGAWAGSFTSEGSVGPITPQQVRAGGPRCRPPAVRPRPRCSSPSYRWSWRRPAGFIGAMARHGVLGIALALVPKHRLEADGLAPRLIIGQPPSSSRSSSVAVR